MSELIFSIIQDNLHLLLEELFIALALPPTFWIVIRYAKWMRKLLNLSKRHIAILEAVTEYSIIEDDCPNKEILERIDLATDSDHYIKNLISELKEKLMEKSKTH